MPPPFYIGTLSPGKVLVELTLTSSLHFRNDMEATLLYFVTNITLNDGDLTVHCEECHSNISMSRKINTSSTDDSPLTP